MASHSLAYIESKPSDFKICKKCKRLNWYENKECIEYLCASEDFEESEDAVVSWVEEERKYWKQDGYNDFLIDEVRVDTK